MVLLFVVAVCSSVLDPLLAHGAHLDIPELQNSTEEAVEEWIAQVEPGMARVLEMARRAKFAYDTNITAENREVHAEAAKVYDGFNAKMVKMAIERINISDITDPILKRKVQLLRPRITTGNPEITVTLQKLRSRMAEAFALARICPPSNVACDMGNRNETWSYDPHIEGFYGSSRNHTELLYVWQAWRDQIGQRVAPLYDEYIQLYTNELKTNGAGFEDIGEKWRYYFEIDDPNFRDNVKSIWKTMLPLFEEVHAYVRRKLHDHYPGAGISLRGTLPAHLLGNIWGQTWGQTADIVIPSEGTGSSADEQINEKLKERFTATSMFEQAEKFFTSIGMRKLPSSFWNMSMIERPTDRAAVCHGSAWDFAYDVKAVKMCTDRNLKDFRTIHHELGHIYYYLAYQDRSPFFRMAANPGFHEAVGDTVFLSVASKKYLREVGLLNDTDATESPNAEIQQLFRVALDSIPFLGFSYTMDLFRWSYFDGSFNISTANSEWWKLRRQYQGLHAPVPRSNDDFDPAAKYHVSNFVAYIRYFTARVLMFQFHEALCNQTGQHVLHDCSIYGHKASGDKLWEMLTKGSAEGWPAVLEGLTGSRRMDASSMLRYFDSLHRWLVEQNDANGECRGWGADWPDDEFGDVAFRQPRC